MENKTPQFRAIPKKYLLIRRELGPFRGLLKQFGLLAIKRLYRCRLIAPDLTLFKSKPLGDSPIAEPAPDVPKKNPIPIPTIAYFDAPVGMKQQLRPVPKSPSFPYLRIHQVLSS